jgi:excisionase family DNA binding protein
MRAALRDGPLLKGRGEERDMGEQTLLTIPEAAKVLRVAVSTLRAWKLQGKFLTFRKIGGRILVHRDDIARFIDAGKIAPAKGAARG